MGDKQEFLFNFAIIGGIALAGAMVSIGLAIVAVAVKNRITLSKAVVLIFNKMKHGKERENGQAKD
jgi:hypothetical protein